MANETMKQMIAARKAAIAAQEAQSEQDKQQDAIDEQLDAHDDAEHQPEEQDTDEMLMQDSDDEDGDDEAAFDDDEDSESENYRDRFNRLKGKMSGLEKEKQAALERAQELEAQLLAAFSHSQTKGSGTTREEAEAKLAEEMGEEWGYLDEPTRNALIRVEMKQAAINPKAEVEKVFSEREAIAKRDSFLSRIDEKLKAQGERSLAFLSNNASFAKWLGADRKRGLIFADAAKHLDAQAEQDILDLVAQYRASNAKNKGKNTSPTVKNQAKSAIVKTAPKISYEAYVQAVKDKAFPSKRKKAREIIAAYKKQEQENG